MLSKVSREMKAGVEKRALQERAQRLQTEKDQRSKVLAHLKRINNS